MNNPSLKLDDQLPIDQANSSRLNSVDTWFEPSVDTAEPRILSAIRTYFNFALLEGPKPSTMMEVVDVYDAAFTHLKMICDEGNAFLTMLCRYQITSTNAGSDTTMLDSVVANELDSRIKKLSLPKVSMSGHLRGELFDEEVSEAFSLLRDDFARSVEKYIGEFVATLNQLLEDNIIGRILWPTKDTCSFGHTNTHFTASEEETRVYEESTSRTTVRSREIESRFRGQQVHLAAANRTRLLEYSGGVPSRIRRLLDEIPPWLAPAIEIVEGEIFRTDKVDRRIKLETHSVSETVEISDRFDSSSRRFQDPAVTLGRFVFAAWLPDEYEKEKAVAQWNKRASLQKQKEQHRLLRLQSFAPIAICATAQVVPVLLHVLAVRIWPALHLFAFLLAFLILLPAGPYFRLISIAHGVKPSIQFDVMALCCMAAAVLAVQFGTIAVIYVAAGPLLAALVAVGACCFLVRELGRMLGD